MGTFRIPIEIGADPGGRFDRQDAVVDTGAMYTMWPQDRLRRMGVQPWKRWPFILADGREVEYEVGWAQVRLEGEVHPTLVIFGEPGSDPLLGAFTLEGFRLAADPVNQRLIPVPGLLKRLAA